MGLNAKDLKTFGIQYLRFGGLGCYIVCTEAGEFHSDVFGINNNSSFELEVKISKSDLLNDVKKPKHSIYKSLDLKYINNIPNYFYYLIPYSLRIDAENVCLGTPYGIILSDTDRLVEGKFSVCKKASPIHAQPPTEELKKTILFRMSSELANYHLNFEKIIKQINIGFTDTINYLNKLDSFIFKDTPVLEKQEIILTDNKEKIKVENNLESFKDFLSN